MSPGPMAQARQSNGPLGRKRSDFSNKNASQRCLKGFHNNLFRRDVYRVLAMRWAMEVAIDFILQAEENEEYCDVFADSALQTVTIQHC